ncbi:hypothetical protein I204_00892 [Kwoniella mangroviensis CBS 8886]|nr:hypothetical protein I204_00892 [Kwoniella mangroviensis CBS 8886]
MTYRDSFISTTSSDTYPSTMSSLSHSALGLTDSPLRPRLRSTLGTSTPASSVPGTPVRTKPSQQQLRQAPSRNSLHQEATTNAARRVVQQQSTEGLRTVAPRSSQTNLTNANGSPPISRPTSRNGTATTTSGGIPSRPATTPVKTTSSPQATNPTRPASTTQIAPPNQPQRAQGTQLQNASQLSRSTQRPPVQRKAVSPSPARTETTLAEEWEAELIQDTRQLNVRPRPKPTPAPLRQAPTAIDREEQRLKDMEWERSGMWDTTRDPVREAEDRVRRDLGRDIAYPPETPRVPVRAAPSDLPDNATRRNQNPRYDSALAEKARKEYEDWKARKAEREGGVGDDGDAHGTRDWVPKSREVARPGNNQMILHQQMQAMQQQAMQMQIPKVKTTAHDRKVPPQGTPKSISKVQPQPTIQNQAQDQTQNQAQKQDAAQLVSDATVGMEGYYPEQGYWDPSYWWGMGGMMGDPQQLGIAQSQGESNEDKEVNDFQCNIRMRNIDIPQILNGIKFMMYNNPYQWGGQSANGMMSGGYNPYMMPGSTMNGFTPSNAGGGGAMSAQSGMTDGGLKPFDSSKMKQGRMGHYGYLEGRELAGPPVGFLPAGVQPEQYHSPSPSAHGQGQISPSHRAASTAGQSYYTAPAPSGGGSVNGSMAWGDMGNTPRARYDGSSSAAGYVQADLDTPYPRTSGGGASSAFTRYGPDGSVVNGIDGRMGINHRRLREGRV